MVLRGGMMEIKEMNLYQRLLAIEGELQTVPKNFEIGTGKYAYKAVSEVDVKRAVRPLEQKYGVKSFPVHAEEIANQIVMNGERANFWLRLRVTYRFVNVDNPSEFIDIPCYGDGIDPGDKAPGKALTYANKYGAIQMYHLQSGDDPDKEASKEYKANCTKEQIERIQILYTPDEISTMMNRLKLDNLSKLSAQKAKEMIDFRDKGGVAEKAETF